MQFQYYSLSSNIIIYRVYSALCSGLLCAGLALSEGGVELLDLPVACAVVGVASVCVCVESVAVECLTVLLVVQTLHESGEFFVDPSSEEECMAEKVYRAMQ